MKGKISIKWNIFAHFLVFTVILLAILWLMQIVYLEAFYKHVKKNELEHALKSVVEVMEEIYYKDKIDEIAGENDIRVILADNEGNRLYLAGTMATEAVIRMDKKQILDIYKMTKENDGSFQISSKKGFEKGIEPKNDKKKEMEKMFDIPEHSAMETMIVAQIVSKNEQEILIIADSVLTPVTATVSAIQIQLIYISIIMIVLSLVMAVLISFHISKPIIQISYIAKKISEGNFEVAFDEKGYKEIAQLSAVLNYTVDELTRSERLQRELIANVSHDLRTPLTMVTAYAEVMRDLPGENTPENVQVIIDEAKRLTGLVNDLLDISKLQAGVMKAEFREYNLTAGIKSVLERYAKLVEQDGYEIDFVCDEGEVWVEADEFKIYQVLYNLVNNAVNYTGPDKKVTVRQILNGGIVRIEVMDTGEGIAEDQLENVWDRYYKIDKNHKRALMGTGLGLSIVKNILRLHHAQYGVNSILGQGSTFWFELKVKNR